jgi:hypothetical protein
VVHEPSRLLGHAQRTAQLVRRDAVLGVGDQPNGWKPLIEAKRRVLEDGPYLERKLTLTALALPNLARRQERSLVVAATGADHRAISPAQTLTNSKQRSASAK